MRQESASPPDDRAHRRRHRPVRLLRGLAILVVAAIVLGWAGGCSSAALPRAPTDEERALVESTRFDFAIAIEQDKSPVYSERLVESLRATGLFARVGTAEELPDAPVIASVTRHIYGTAAIPCATLVTFGLFPSMVDEEWGEAFRLRSRRGEAPEFEIDYSYTGTSTLGVFAGVMNLLPGYTSADPRSTDRFRVAFAAAICKRADRIRALASD